MTHTLSSKYDRYKKKEFSSNQITKKIFGENTDICTFQDIYLHDPSVRWDSIIGLDAAKRTIKEAVVYPIRVGISIYKDQQQKKGKTTNHLSF